jgi:hypothetical protein
MMDEVRAKAGGGIFEPGRGVDVEAILERVYKVSPDYVDLPPGVLGRTNFHPDGRLEVQVSRELSDAAEIDPVARRRLRRTLAHECAHIVEHRHLHVPELLMPSLFGEAPREIPKVLCRQEAVESFKNPGAPGYDGQWWEYQANRGMASLLLPKYETAEYLRGLLVGKGLTSIERALAAGRTEEVVREVMAAFDVSRQVVVFRLQELQMLPKTTSQASLALEE